MVVKRDEVTWKEGVVVVGISSGKITIEGDRKARDYKVAK